MSDQNTGDQTLEQIALADAASQTKADVGKPKAKAAPAPEGLEARVLTATGDYKVNDVITGEDARAAIDAGWADSSSEAVAYAHSLAAE